MNQRTQGVWFEINLESYRTFSRPLFLRQYLLENSFLEGRYIQPTLVKCKSKSKLSLYLHTSVFYCLWKDPTSQPKLYIPSTLNIDFMLWHTQSKILNHGSYHGSFLSLFKLIPWPIHWIVYVLAYLKSYLNFKTD